MQQQQNDGPALRRRRPRGVLAFLGHQQEHVTHYPYDSDAWKTPKPIPTRSSRSTRRSRRNRNQQQPQPQPSITITQTPGNDSDNSHHVHVVDNDNPNGNSYSNGHQAHKVSTESRLLVDICEEYPVILLFLFDPHQPHSFQIRNQLVRLLTSAAVGENRQQVHCLCATMADSTNNDDIDAVQDFLQDTGFSQFTVTAAVQTCFHWTRAPYLTVVGRTSSTPSTVKSGNYSRKVISTAHEELALAWNTDQVSIERWLEGQSALSCQQQGMAMAIFPDCSIL
jgi:hypothetical protein